MVNTQRKHIYHISPNKCPLCRHLSEPEEQPGIVSSVFDPFSLFKSLSLEQVGLDGQKSWGASIQTGAFIWRHMLSVLQWVCMWAYHHDPHARLIDWLVLLFRPVSVLRLCVVEISAEVCTALLVHTWLDMSAYKKPECYWPLQGIVDYVPLRDSRIILPAGAFHQPSLRLQNAGFELVYTCS